MGKESIVGPSLDPSREVVGVKLGVTEGPREFLDRNFRHDDKTYLLLIFVLLEVTVSRFDAASSTGLEPLNSADAPTTPTSLPSFFDRLACA